MRAQRYLVILDIPHMQVLLGFAEAEAWSSRTEQDRVARCPSTTSINPGGANEALCPDSAGGIDAAGLGGSQPLLLEVTSASFMQNSPQQLNQDAGLLKNRQSWAELQLFLLQS